MFFCFFFVTLHLFYLLRSESREMKQFVINELLRNAETLIHVHAAPENGGRTAAKDSYEIQLTHRQLSFSLLLP